MHCLLIAVNHAEIPTRLTYHVQVFELTDAFAKLNSTAQSDLNSKSAQANGAEQHYFPQIDQPEPGKRVASKSPTSSPPSLSDVPAPTLVMDTINFTNPLFIITNLSASTNYLLKIWSSTAHNLDATLEQVNITVRTQASPHQHHPPNNNTLMTLMQLSSQKLMLLAALVAFICAIFVALILISAAFKIRAVLEIRKGMSD